MVRRHLVQHVLEISGLRSPTDQLVSLIRQMVARDLVCESASTTSIRQIGIARPGYPVGPGSGVFIPFRIAFRDHHTLIGQEIRHPHGFQRRTRDLAKIQDQSASANPTVALASIELKDHQHGDAVLFTAMANATQGGDSRWTPCTDASAPRGGSDRQHSRDYSPTPGTGQTTRPSPGDPRKFPAVGSEL